MHCFTQRGDAGTKLQLWRAMREPSLLVGLLPYLSTPVPVPQGALAHLYYSIDSRVWAAPSGGRSEPTMKAACLAAFVAIPPHG